MNKKDYDFNKKTPASIGLCDVLLVVFIVLKLCHVIDWSWWWVLAPLWIPVLLVIIICVILYFMDRKMS